MGNVEKRKIECAHDNKSPKINALTKSFRGNLNLKVKELVYSLIIKKNLAYGDFESDALLVYILRQLKIPSTPEETVLSKGKINNNAIAGLKKKKHLFLDILQHKSYLVQTDLFSIFHPSFLDRAPLSNHNISNFYDN